MRPPPLVFQGFVPPRVATPSQLAPPPPEPLPTGTYLANLPYQPKKVLERQPAAQTQPPARSVATTPTTIAASLLMVLAAGHLRWLGRRV